MSLSAWRTPTLAVDINVYPSNCHIFASRRLPIKFQRWIWCIIRWRSQQTHWRALSADRLKIGKGFVLVSLSTWRSPTLAVDLNVYPSNCHIFASQHLPIKFQRWIWCRIFWRSQRTHRRALNADRLKIGKGFVLVSLLAWRSPTLAVDLNVYPSNCHIFASRLPR